MNSELAWASGLFEGEGCITFSSPNNYAQRYPRLQMTTTDRDVAERFHAALGVGKVLGPYQERTGNYKPVYRWVAQNFEHTQQAIAALWSGLGERRRARAAVVFSRNKGK